MPNPCPGMECISEDPRTGSVLPPVCAHTRREGSAALRSRGLRRCPSPGLTVHRIGIPRYGFVKEPCTAQAGKKSIDFFAGSCYYTGIGAVC